MLELLVIIGLIWLVSNVVKTNKDSRPYSSQIDRKNTSSYLSSRDALSKSFGKSYSHRTTHCHSCKNTISSNTSKTCINCGWLICNNCGACSYTCASTASHSSDKKSVITTNSALNYNDYQSERFDEAYQLLQSDVSSDDEYLIDEDTCFNDAYEYAEELKYEEDIRQANYEAEHDNNIDLGYGDEIEWENR